MIVRSQYASPLHLVADKEPISWNYGEIRPAKMVAIHPTNILIEDLGINSFREQRYIKFDAFIPTMERGIPIPRSFMRMGIKRNSKSDVRHLRKELGIVGSKRMIEYGNIFAFLNCTDRNPQLHSFCSRSPSHLEEQVFQVQKHVSELQEDFSRGKNDLRIFF
ncbi:hypothetical protein L2E82_22451 [Cichorium intybus]|uniref:Uncharacterized protein n=1 Tax=Cichorium intybus TaxID=13427 RepID=A0ACB9DXT3_CICIN|nr:hypothetical protein L2E82_22451 [Cichorium intybus]